MHMHDHAVLAASGERKWGRAAVSLLRKLILLLCIVLLICVCRCVMVTVASMCHVVLQLVLRRECRVSWVASFVGVCACATVRKLCWSFVMKLSLLGAFWARHGRFLAVRVVLVGMVSVINCVLVFCFVVLVVACACLCIGVVVYFCRVGSLLLLLCVGVA